jgi:hypothetical protein
MPSSVCEGTGSVKVEFSRDWTEFLSAMISHHARFVLVGGHAVAVHAEPRLTEDLDVFVEVSPENARRLHAALVELGFGRLAPSVQDLTVPGKIWMLGRKPHRIDILTEISGVSFDEAWKGRIEVDFARKHLFVIGRAALLKNKLAAGREKDLRDVAMLRAGTAPRKRKKKKR